MKIHWWCFVTGHVWENENELPGWHGEPTLANGEVRYIQVWRRGWFNRRCCECGKGSGFLVYGPTSEEAQLARIQHTLGIAVRDDFLRGLDAAVEPSRSA